MFVCRTREARLRSGGLAASAPQQPQARERWRKTAAGSPQGAATGRWQVKVGRLQRAAWSDACALMLRGRSGCAPCTKHSTSPLHEGAPALVLPRHFDSLAPAQLPPGYTFDFPIQTRRYRAGVALRAACGSLPRTFPRAGVAAVTREARINGGYSGRGASDSPELRQVLAVGFEEFGGEAADAGQREQRPGERVHGHGLLDAGRVAGLGAQHGELLHVDIRLV